MPGEFEGKVAIVTGVSSGIGKATAIEFGRKGATVVVAARREEESLETVALIDEAGGSGHYIRTDVTMPAEVESLIKTTMDRFGKLDFAFNNAGSSSSSEKKLHEFDEDEYEYLPDMYLKKRVEMHEIRDRGHDGTGLRGHH